MRVVVFVLVGWCVLSLVFVAGWSIGWRIARAQHETDEVTRCG